jgi:hypothetical protein
VKSGRRTPLPLQFLPIMNQSKEEINKALLLEAFDTLFNKKDFAKAAEYCASSLRTKGKTSCGLLLNLADFCASRAFSELPERILVLDSE